MAMVLDPNQPMSCSVQLEGGTMMFMSPELLIPSKFGVKEAVPTPEADIYAFGHVVFQVREQGCSCRSFLIICSGPYRRNPVSWSSAHGSEILGGSGAPPNQTRECLSYRVF